MKGISVATDGSSPTRRVAGTRGAWMGIGVALAVLVLASVFLLATFTQDIDSGAFTVLAALFGLAVAVAIFVGNASLQRLRARRVAVAFGPHDWAGVCVEADRPRRLLVLVVNDDGLHLLTMRRKLLMTLGYTTLSDASSCTVKIGAVNHSGVYLANDGSPPLLLAFPTGFGVGFSGRAVDQVGGLTRPRLRGQRQRRPGDV